MREPEFTRTADGKYWMDTSIVSNIPLKMTIIDPRQYIDGLVQALLPLPIIVKEDYNKEELKVISKKCIYGLMQAIVRRRQAWKYGEEADCEVHRNRITLSILFFDIDAELKNSILEEITESDFSYALVNNVINEILDLFEKHMNSNRFVLHHLTESRDSKTFMIEEFSDWRIMQWTLQQQSTIDSRHEDLGRTFAA